MPLRVVGVAEDLRNTTPDREPYPEVFIDYRDCWRSSSDRGKPPERWQHERSLGLLSFAVRASNDPTRLIPAVGQIVRAVDPNAGVDGILSVETWWRARSRDPASTQ